MKEFFLAIFFMSLFYHPSFAGNGGGTVVGNGAGIVESDFQEAYSNLPKILSSCELSVFCRVDEEDRRILAEIKTVALKNMKKKDRLVFISEKEHPGFFTTGNFENHRIAKTGLNADSPIFINRDLLYGHEGRPVIGFSAMIRILIHEIGHQSGVLSHEALDILGAKLGDFAGQNTAIYNYRSEEEDREVSFSITNLETPIREVVIISRTSNKKAENLSEALVRAVACPQKSQVYVGVEVSNCHYVFDASGRLSFKGWVKVYCSDASTGSSMNYRREMEVELDENLSPLGLFVY